MATPLIGDYLNQIETYHGWSLNYWVGGLMNITAQTRYDIQYITMRLSGYMNATTETEFIALRHGILYLMHQQNEPSIYSRKNFSKKLYPTSIFLQGSYCRDKPNTRIFQFPSHIMWCISHKKSQWQVINHLRSSPLQRNHHRLASQETIRDINNHYQFRNKSNTYRCVRPEID